MYLSQYENIECIDIIIKKNSFAIFTVFISKCETCQNVIFVISIRYMKIFLSYSNVILHPCSNVNNFLFIEGSVELHLAYCQCKTDIDNFHSKRSKHMVKSLLTNLWQSLITSPIITETLLQCCVALQGAQFSFCKRTKCRRSL